MIFYIDMFVIELYRKCLIYGLNLIREGEIFFGFDLIFFDVNGLKRKMINMCVFL